VFALYFLREMKGRPAHGQHPPASLSGDAVANFSGNLGINHASGTNNLQSNRLSMAVANP
jgi:hypothetical protein